MRISFGDDTKTIPQWMREIFNLLGEWKRQDLAREMIDYLLASAQMVSWIRGTICDVCAVEIASQIEAAKNGTGRILLDLGKETH